MTTVNGDQAIPSPVRQLPDLDQPANETDVIAQDIFAALGDAHSRRFYRLVAAKIRRDVIYRALSEIKADGAQDPPRTFTYRMNRYALERLGKIGNLGNGAHPG